MLIQEKDAQDLRRHLQEHLTEPVTMDLFMAPSSSLWVPGRTECETCDDARQLLEEVSALSDKIELRVHNVLEEQGEQGEAHRDSVPAIVLRGGAKGQVRFLGLPGGLEFTTFLRSLIDVSHGETSLAGETKERLRSLAKDVHIRVFVTPSCPYCPQVAQIAHQMAVESEHVTADVIEAQEFPELSGHYDVQGVPKVVVNETVHFVGAQPERSFLDHVLRAAA